MFCREAMEVDYCNRQAGLATESVTVHFKRAVCLELGVERHRLKQPDAEVESRRARPLQPGR
jgi:hypothetical protein